MEYLPDKAARNTKTSLNYLKEQILQSNGMKLESIKEWHLGNL